MFSNTYGIEIECYLPGGTNHAMAAAAISARGVPCQAQNYNHQVTTCWKIVTDGSLNDYARGIEVVSPILSGPDGLIAIATVMDALSDFGCTVTRACGLHVHVGVGTPQADFFKNLFKLYSKNEAVIDGFMPPSRRANANTYCRSVIKNEAHIDAAAGLGGLQRLLGHDRYHKLNLMSYARYQTVEFRQHSGTLEGAKAVNWTRFCLRMVKAAQDGKSGATVATSDAAPQTNKGRRGTMAYVVGQLFLRPEGVTKDEACQATGWRSISMPQQARSCGLTFVTRREGREVRYFANLSNAPVEASPTLDNLLALLGCDETEAGYFRARTANLSGTVAWAA
jgi:hypothetical protein